MNRHIIQYIYKQIKLKILTEAKLICHFSWTPPLSQKERGNFCAYKIFIILHHDLIEHLWLVEFYAVSCDLLGTLPDWSQQGSWSEYHWPVPQSFPGMISPLHLSEKSKQRQLQHISSSMLSYFMFLWKN